MSERMTEDVVGPVIRHSDYARGGAVIGDTVEQINAFTERCLMLRKVLGAGVHSRAIGRLAEVWPEVQVEVRHDRTWRGIPFTGKRVQLRRTTVEIWEGEKNPIPLPAGQPANHRHVTREAVCHPEDTFGIRLAFDRCLREAVRRAEPARVTEGRRS